MTLSAWTGSAVSTSSKQSRKQVVGATRDATASSKLRFDVSESNLEHRRENNEIKGCCKSLLKDNVTSFIKKPRLLPQEVDDSLLFVCFFKTGKEHRYLCTRPQLCVGPKWSRLLRPSLPLRQNRRFSLRIPVITVLYQKVLYAAWRAAAPARLSGNKSRQPVLFSPSC